MAKDDLEKRYRFAGDGLGVPGLPHEISMQDAIDLGAKELLEELIRTGTYVAVAPPPTPPQMSPSGRNLERGDKGKKEK